jgi:hypothetical protein
MSDPVRTSFALDRETRELIRSLATAYAISQAAVIRLGIRLAQDELAELAAEQQRVLANAEFHEALAADARKRASIIFPR